jgi:hypothetical protein
MENKGTIVAGVIGLVLVVVGGVFLFKSSKPNTQNDNNAPPAEQPTNNTSNTSTTNTTTKPKVTSSSTHTVSTISSPPSTLSTTPNSAVTQKVYSKPYQIGVPIKLMATGNTTANPIVLGEQIRAIESDGENLGTFTKYITIFSVPYALFKEGYSGRNSLIPKSSVTIK